MPRKRTKAPRIRLLDGLPAKSEQGQPTLLTDAVQAGICRALSSGVDFAIAAEYAGINEGTAKNWRTWGKQGRSPRLREFYDAVTKARADAAVGFVAVVTKAAQSGKWPAAAWMLEHMFPRLYGPKVQVEVTHELEAFCTELRRLLPPEWMQRVDDLVEDRTGPASAAAGERILEAVATPPAAG